MTVQMINQRFQFGKDESIMTKNDYGKGYDLDRWFTSYITDIPIATDTDTAKKEIIEFCQQNLDKQLNVGLGDLTLERNCLLGYWQFTLMTLSELTVGLPDFNS